MSVHTVALSAKFSEQAEIDTFFYSLWCLNTGFALVAKATDVHLFSLVAHKATVHVSTDNHTSYNTQGLIEELAVFATLLLFACVDALTRHKRAAVIFHWTSCLCLGLFTCFQSGKICFFFKPHKHALTPNTSIFTAEVICFLLSLSALWLPILSAQ